MESLDDILVKRTEGKFAGYKVIQVAQSGFTVDENNIMP